MWSQRVLGAGIGNYIYFWKSKGLSDKNNTAPKTSDYSFNPQLSYIGNKVRVEFKGACLKQHKIASTYGKIINTYIAYEISKSYKISSYPIL